MQLKFTGFSPFSRDPCSEIFGYENVLFIEEKLQLYHWKRLQLDTQPNQRLKLAITYVDLMCLSFTNRKIYFSSIDELETFISFGN